MRMPAAPWPRGIRFASRRAAASKTTKSGPASVETKASLPSSVNLRRLAPRTFAASVRGANRLKFTLDGKLAFVSTLAGPDLVVFDAAARREAKRIPLGHGAAGILIQPDGSRAFVACTPDNYVVAIDLRSLQVTAHVDAGQQPDGLAWAHQM